MLFNKMIRIIVEDRSGERKPLQIPGDIQLSLMEVLTASGYDILATCGGIALCATCRVEVLSGGEQLPLPGGMELAMLDSLPDSEESSRLACQLWMSDVMDGMVIRISG
jgi:2Fe-2S ferredoxin